MRIAFVYDVIYPWVKGGVEKRIYELAKRLAKKNEVHVYGYKLWEGQNLIERDGIIYHGTTTPKGLYKNGVRRISPPLNHSIHLIYRISSEHFDVIDCQASPYFPAYSSKMSALFRGSNLVITWHEFWGEYWEDYLGFLGVFGKFIERELFSLTDNHISVSLKTKKDLMDAGFRGNIHIIPNGIDFKKIRNIKAVGFDSDIIFVGRLIKEKNVELLLKAVKIIKGEIPDVRIVIIGDGPERTKLESLSKKLGISSNVNFLGFLETHEEVIAYMKASKVFAFPSLREGFGIVVLEANASGLPVVTVDHEMNASKDLIIGRKSGFVTKLDEIDFAEKILIALENRKKMGHIAIHTAGKYDWNEITKKLEQYYEGIL